MGQNRQIRNIPGDRSVRLITNTGRGFLVYSRMDTRASTSPIGISTPLRAPRKPCKNLWAGHPGSPRLRKPASAAAQNLATNSAASHSRPASQSSATATWIGSTTPGTVAGALRTIGATTWATSVPRWSDASQTTASSASRAAECVVCKGRRGTCRFKRCTLARARAKSPVFGFMSFRYMPGISVFRPECERRFHGAASIRFVDLPSALVGALAT